MNPKRITPAIEATLHVYSPWTWHDDARLIGNREALEALQEALTHVLAGQGTAILQTFTSDGEGFDLEVRMVTREEMDQLPMPYTDRDTNPLPREEP